VARRELQGLHRHHRRVVGRAGLATGPPASTAAVASPAASNAERPWPARPQATDRVLRFQCVPRPPRLHGEPHAAPGPAARGGDSMPGLRAKGLGALPPPRRQRGSGWTWARWVGISPPRLQPGGRRAGALREVGRAGRPAPAPATRPVVRLDAGEIHAAPVEAGGVASHHGRVSFNGWHAPQPF
jgi:hypothetical protein